MGTQWTEKEDAVLIDLREQGMSYGHIADRIGKTRKAVIGRAYRLKLCHSETRPKTIYQQVLDLFSKGWSYSNIERSLGLKIDQKTRERISTRCGSFSFRRPRVKMTAKLFFSEVKIPATKTLAELGPKDCRFPQGDGPYLFCGGKVNGHGPYCERCTKIAYNVSVKNNRRSGKSESKAA